MGQPARPCYCMFCRAMELGPAWSSVDAGVEHSLLNIKGVYPVAQLTQLQEHTFNASAKPGVRNNEATGGFGMA